MITLPTHDEVMAMYPSDNVVNITDQRDIDEINRRKKLKLWQPDKNELYSVNPDFNGIYTDL